MKNNSQTPQTITYLKDYKAPAYWVETIDLVFDLQPEKTYVKSTLKMQKNAAYTETANLPLVLSGVKLTLKSITLDQKPLSTSDYTIDSESLTIPKVPEKFTLEIETEICPKDNTELSGLYYAKDIFCTQNESQGFRRITYYPDRPDVMAKFTTTIFADKKRFPVLLSNGNCIEKGLSGEDRHWVKWEDPFKKPCYLFALVAGDLVALEDHFVTRSQRLVTLKIFVERENQDKCAHALEALKKSMKWDEDTYGREYDLDIYMIVAVNDFNMGAMENKGLNIFNSKYILACPETATDWDFQHVDAVVGHEYFHNWSGNRVTCRDWFQLSLKEGLTVFREHHFSSDISKSPVALIENTRYLRSTQFAEDAGPMAHPVRPESYIEINNFYTATVYEKGSVVIRMIKTLLGWETFRRGMDLYFERHDGQAVTIEDFVAAMEAVSKQDLSQFRRWYSQAGTPEITVAEQYDPASQNYQITLKQSCKPTPGQPQKEPFVIPIATGLLDKKGHDLLEQGKEGKESQEGKGTTTLILNSPEQTFNFPKISEKPYLSILRNFSAPVIIKPFQNEETLAFLLANDSDPFNRWEAGQKFSELLIWQCVEKLQNKEKLSLEKSSGLEHIWLESYRKILTEEKLNPALRAEIFSLPSLSYLIGLKAPADIDNLYLSGKFLREQLAIQCKKELLNAYHAHLDTDLYQYTPEKVAARNLKNVCLAYLMLNKQDQEVLDIGKQQWKTANNMTDSIAVLTNFANWEGEEREEVFKEFYERWKNNALVLDKWFRIQAGSDRKDVLTLVKKLMEHPDFSIKNPNKVYSLVGGFTANLPYFHDKSGGGYEFLADTVIKLNALNPQVAARMINPFTRWKQFDKERQALMRAQLERLRVVPNLSKDLFEIISKSLE